MTTFIQHLRHKLHFLPIAALLLVITSPSHATEASSKQTIPYAITDLTVQIELEALLVSIKHNIPAKELKQRIICVKWKMAGGGLAEGASYQRLLTPLHSLPDQTPWKLEHAFTNGICCRQEPNRFIFKLPRSGIYKIPGLSGKPTIRIHLQEEDNERELSNTVVAQPAIN